MLFAHSTDLKAAVRAYALESAKVKQRAAYLCSADVARAAQAIAGAFSTGGKLLIFGNGGSAADSQHIATEFTSTLTRDFARRPLAAIALTTDTSFLTAFANDFGFEGVFARQVEALGKVGDVALALTTSGNSQNVTLGLQAAKAARLFTVVFTGDSGGMAASIADIAVRVPSNFTGHIQEAHLALAHGLCAAVEATLFGNAASQELKAA